MRWLVAIAAIVTCALAITMHIAGRAPSQNVGRGPGRTCVLPPRTCTERCDELVEMPLVGIGYFDAREREELIEATSTSFLRRDLKMVIEYAAAKVLCKSSTWNTGIGGPIALGDMSQQDGATPGTLWGQARHPRNTHVDGLALDIAYFQRDTPNNRQRAICPHTARKGTGASAGVMIERWHCIAPPDRLDAWRTALFIGAILEEPRIRVIGVDGRAAAPIIAAFDELCRTRWIDAFACRREKIRFETRNKGHGWFFGHHDHLHVAISDADR